MSSVSAIVAKARIAVSTTGLNSGPGSAGGSGSHAASPMRTRRGRRAPVPAPSAASPSEHEDDGAARAPAREREPGAPTPATATAAVAPAPSATASAAVEEAPIAASSHDSRLTGPQRTSTSTDGGDGGERAGRERARLRLARQRGLAGGCQRERENGWAPGMGRRAMTAPAHATAPATRKAPAIESTSIQGSSRTARTGSTTGRE